MMGSKHEAARRVAILGMALGCLPMLACAGQQKKGSDGLPADAPAWVHRGSVVKDKIVYGVGISTGVKNPALAQSRAGNRARNEIQKIMQTYSASLMKDYQASTATGDLSDSSEEQRVEEAVKTFTQGLLSGVEVSNYWQDPNSSALYAQAVLDFDRQAQIEQAKQGPGMEAWFEKYKDQALADLEKDMKPVAPAPAPAAEAADEGGAEVAPEDNPNDGPAAKVGGAMPGWVTGDCDRQKYLCGVGDGSDMSPADNDARAELARIFQSKIQAVSKSFASAARQISSKTGEQWIQRDSISEMSMVSTDKVLPMSEILARWSDGKGKFFSLAVIDRAKAGRMLRDRIMQQDQIIGDNVSSAQATQDNLSRLKSLKRAVEAYTKREAMNSDLQVITGQGIAPPYPLSQILSMLGAANESLRLAITLSGTGAEAVQSCLERALTAKGYQIESMVDEDADDPSEVSGSYDVIIKGRVKAEKRGRVHGSEVVQATLTLKLINGKTGRTLRTISGYEKGSRRTVKSAATTAAAKVCARKVPQLVQDIDRSFSR